MTGQFSFVCPTVDDTKALAAVIGGVVKGGDVLTFTSDIGGGKTTFVKGLATGMGVTDLVQSPTFTISQLHKAERGLELHHFDFYRLDDPGVVAAELAESLVQSNAVTAVEWGDVVHDALPASRIVVSITTPHDEDRVISIDCPANAEHIRQALQGYQEMGKVA
jgi:tRNA threonylcarbamoyladenosine biosynthesis protein TsaE